MESAKRSQIMTSGEPRIKSNVRGENPSRLWSSAGTLCHSLRLDLFFRTVHRQKELSGQSN